MIYLFFAFLLAIGFMALFSFAIKFFQMLPVYYDSVFLPFMNQLTGSFQQVFLFLPQDIIVIFQNWIHQNIFQAISFASQFIQSIPSFLFSFFIFMISTFFFMLDYEDMKSCFLRFISHQTYIKLVQLKNHVLKSLWIYIKCQFTLMFVTFMILWIAFMILDIEPALSYAFAISLLDGLPFIGVGIILIPMMLLYAFQGIYMKSLYLFCLYILINMIHQFFGKDLDAKVHLVNEGDTLNVGEHTFTFVNAPMVHWPEVMMSYEMKDKILFSADAFGTFGALNGHLFNDEVDFFNDYLDEARRYYTNIVGKYGPQVQAVLKKASGLDIKLICPLHGFVWRNNFAKIIEKYNLWSSYTPEEKGVLIAYSSVYGHTENAMNILACQLVERGVKVDVYDLSLTDVSVVVSNAFKYSHIVLGSTTYNMGIFLLMHNLLHDLQAHNLSSRTIAIVENGSWAPQAGKLMKEEVNKMKNMTILEEDVTIKSSVDEDSYLKLVALADAIKKSLE